MKKTTTTLLSVGLFCAAALFAHAQPAPKVAVVDMDKIFKNHYQTVAEDAKLKAAQDKAQQDLDGMRKEATDLYNQFKELNDQVSNPTATADAKSKATADAQKKQQEVQAKVNDLNNFTSNVKAQLQQQMNSFRSMLLDQISKTVIEVAKRHDATLVFDKSGPTLAGIPAVIYADPAYDITDEVMAEINKNKPASTPAAPAATAPSAASSDAPGSGDAPKITVPGK